MGGKKLLNISMFNMNHLKKNTSLEIHFGNKTTGNYLLLWNLSGKLLADAMTGTSINLIPRPRKVIVLVKPHME